MVRAVLVVAAAVSAAASGVSAPTERPAAPIASAIDGYSLDRDDFTNRDDFDGGGGGEGH